MASMVIRGGRVVDPDQGIDRVDDLLIRDGLIMSIGHDGSQPLGKVDETIDAHGFIVTPGLVDMHVHLREPVVKRMKLLRLEPKQPWRVASRVLPVSPTPSRQLIPRPT